MRRPGARIDRYFGAAIVALLVIPALLAWSRRAGATQWQRFQSVAAAAQAEIDARDASRPVLWGEAQEQIAARCLAPLRYLVSCRS